MFRKEPKEKSFEKCMIQLKSILWTIEHESREKICSLFLLGFKDLSHSPFLESLIENIETISSEKKYLILNFSPSLCGQIGTNDAKLEEFLKGDKKWKECYSSLNSDTIHYSEIEYNHETDSKVDAKLAKSLRLFAKSYDKVLIIGPNSNFQFVQQHLISKSDDVFLFIRSQSSQWRHLKYFLDELKGYRTKLRTSWVINSFN